MIKPKSFSSFAIALFFLFVSQSSTAQFINLNFTVKSELSVTAEQHLDFGSLASNSGIQNINLGDINAGIFAIRAYYTQNVFVEVNAPEYLLSETINSNDKIPITLHASYSNTGLNNPKNSTPLLNNIGYIPIHKNNTSIVKTDVWQELFIYIYGTIDVGNIEKGIYSGVVVLYIDYD